MSLICWWCVHDLPQRPCIHLPIHYDEKLKLFKTIGNFCSWQCAKAYANDMNSPRMGEIQSFLALMRKQAFGKYTPLWPAPSRLALKCFGGSLTIDEFRKFDGTVEPPQVFFPFEKRYVPIETSSMASSSVTVGTTKKGHIREIENSTLEGDTLKLKRSKPLARTTSTLETSLGIKRKGKS